ncbi:MAG: citramalate synthase [Candidatus Desulforudis sp.]|nr:citramalate synthase [Desulforudis sp.]
MTPTVQIYDTTLRDGTQGEGVSFSVEDKLKIARRLDQIGCHYIEGGWPGSNPKDAEFFQRARDENFRNAKLCAFGSTRKAGHSVSADANLQALVDSKAPVVTIFGKSWDFHVYQVLGTTLEENLAMIRDSVAFLKSQGLEVIFDAEHFFDGYRANPQYAMATVRAAVHAGADSVALCETNGGFLPTELQETVAYVRQAVNVPLGIHAHNDGGLAVANSILAVEAGCAHVQGTINGYGERCGNADLCVLIPNLIFKKRFPSIPEENLVHLTELSRYVSELANLNPEVRQPFVGTSAFSHKAGMHVNALLKDSQTYEHLPPESVGNKRQVLVSELSGLSNLVYKYRELNLGLDQESAEYRRILSELKELEHQGFQFEGAEGSFELLLRKAYNGYEKPFVLETMRILTELKDESHVYSEAIIKLRVKDQVVHTAAEGNGPVNALDAALRKALEEFYPAISKIQLHDYKVRVLNEHAGTGAVVRVLIETGDGRKSWGTVGVSSNIIEASWQALADSFAYGILKLSENSGSDESDS